MIHEKRMGEYCNFVKRFVPIEIKYPPDGPAQKSCENSACGNSQCCLCDQFTGDESQSVNFLGEPKQGSE